MSEHGSGGSARIGTTLHPIGEADETFADSTFDITLVTMDARLAQAPGIRASVEVYE